MASAYLAAEQRIESIACLSEDAEDMMAQSALAQEGIMLACKLGIAGLLLHLKVNLNPAIIAPDLRHELRGASEIARAVLGLPVGDDELWNEFWR